MKRIPNIELGLVIICLVLPSIVLDLGLIVCFALVLLYIFVKNRKERLRSIGFKRPDNIGRMLLITALVGGFTQIFFLSIIEPLIEMAIGSKLDLSSFEGMKGNIPNFIIMLIVGWLIGGFLEEILFRGFLVTRISELFKNERLGQFIAILLTSILFGMGHMYQDWAGVISTGLMAVIFGIVFISANKNLWYPIMIHGFNNTLGITVIFLDAEETISTLFIY